MNVVALVACCIHPGIVRVQLWLSYKPGSYHALVYRTAVYVQVISILFMCDIGILCRHCREVAEFKAGAVAILAVRISDFVCCVVYTSRATWPVSPRLQ